MRLTSQERVALAYLAEARGRMTGAELGELLESSERTGRRVLSNLLTKGAVERLSRGRYLISEVAVQRSNVAAQRPDVAVPVLVSTTTSTYRGIEDSNESSIPAARGSIQEEYREERFPVGDVLPGKLSDDPPKPRRISRRSSPPPSGDVVWTVDAAASEFRRLAQYAFKRSIFAVNMRDLHAVFAMIAKDHGLTPAQIVDLMNQFFASKRVESVPPDVSPERFFLAFVRDSLFNRPVEANVDHYADWNEGWS